MAGFMIGIAAGVLALLALGVLGLSFRLSSRVVKPARDTAEQAERLEIERGNLVPGELAALRFIEGETATFDGVTLKYAWLPCGTETDRAVVLVHGFGSRREHMLKYAKLYRKHGYDALLFDHRHSGESGGRFTTMGYKERHDLKHMVELAREQYAVVGIHGESMGAATALLAACLGAPVDFVVADCAYCDLTEQLTYNMKRITHLPPRPFRRVVSGITKARAGFRYGDVSPLREIKKLKGLPDVPILFVHGSLDETVPCSATEKLYAAKQGGKDLYICAGAGHAQSLAMDRREYERRLLAFLGRCGV